MSLVKQVIVMRSDLRNTEGHKVMKGKLIAQGAHASMAVLLNQMTKDRERYDHGFGGYETVSDTVDWNLSVKDNTPLSAWLNGSFTKVCLAATSEEQLLNIYQKAKDAGLPCYLITDAGLTEFGGIPTNTCIAIGPAFSNIIDLYTGELSLFK